MNYIIKLFICTAVNHRMLPAYSPFQDRDFDENKENLLGEAFTIGH